MKSHVMGSTVLLAGAALLCFGIPTIARAQVTVTFTGGYTTTFQNSDGDFGAGIYSANIDGAPSSSGIICDDYRDEIYTNETWNANAYQASSLASGNLANTLFGNTIGLNGYAQVIGLGTLMFDNIHSYDGITNITQSELSSAIWDITTPGGINGLDSNALALVSLAGTIFNAGNNNAQSFLSGLTNLWILTPNPHPGPGLGLEPQEMLIENLNVPEGGAPLLYLLLAGFSCFGALYLSRRRMQAAQ